jgi:NtrC-family two-component system sensor histidine kinase KinB
VTWWLAATVVAAIGGFAGGWSVARRSRPPAPTDERAQLIERLSALVGGLNTDLNAGEVLHRIVESAAELVQADGSAYARLEDARSTIVAAHDIDQAVVGFAIGPGEGVMSNVIESRRPLVVNDYQTYPQRVPAMASALAHLHTLVVVPSVVDGGVSGALFVMFRQPDRAVSRDELDVLALLAAHAGTALANAAVFEETVRREAHEAAVVEALADGVAVIDRAGLVTSWNSAAAEMTDIRAALAVGRPPPVPVPRPGHPIEHEWPGDRWLEIVTTHLQATNETVLVLRDVSEQKRLERAQSLFLATTTHEIKTPLTVVSGFATTLQKRWDELNPEDRERALSAIVRRSEALVRLIDQLLLGFRVQAGQLELDLRAMDLRGVLEAAVAGFETMSETHRVTLEVGDLPLVIGDSRAVDQVIGQLLENALKYSPDGGPITITATTRNGSVAVSVTDKGVGLQPGDAERVFSRYFRASGTGKVGGVGLGLYIVRRLVEAQGGTVLAFGAPGEGATFEFTLPVAR